MSQNHSPSAELFRIAKFVLFAIAAAAHPKRSKISVAALGLALLAFSDSVRASLLQVEFQQSSSDTPQSGFSQFVAGSGPIAPTTETFGNYNVTLTAQTDSADLGGGDFDRNQTGGSFSALSNSGSFTYATLYNSFAFNNSSVTGGSTESTNLTVALNGAGISPSTTYLLQFYSYDTDAGRPATSGTHQFSVAGASGTTGSTGVLTWADTSHPTSNNQDSIFGNFTSDATGKLTFLVSDTYTGNLDSRSGVRLNALILSVPEPGTLMLLAVGCGALGVWRRRRKSRRW